LELEKIGFDAEEFHDDGYNPDELKDLHFTFDTLILAGYNLKELYIAG
jgi:hypothetical protein